MILAHRHEFEQALVNRAQFLGRHVAPVDADAAIVVHQPAQLEDRRHEGAIGKLRIIQVRRQTAGKDSPECRQAQQFLAAFQRAKHDLRPFPGVEVMIVGGSPNRSVAQMREAVAIKIQRAHRRAYAGRQKQIAIFGHGEENQAIDDTQKLLEPCLHRKRLIVELGAQVGIGIEKSLTQRKSVSSTLPRRRSRAAVPARWPASRHLSSGS